jgi:hypothetical protein
MASEEKRLRAEMQASDDALVANLAQDEFARYDHSQHGKADQIKGGSKARILRSVFCLEIHDVSITRFICREPAS